MNNDSINIKVTQHHISLGIKGDCSCCPIARAIADSVQWSPALEGPLWRVIKVFDSNDIKIRGKKYSTTFEVNNWINSFDDGLEVNPIELVLTPVEKDEILF